MYLDSELAEKYSELTNYVKDLFGDKLKNEYFKIKFSNNKEKLPNYKYTQLFNFFINDELDNKNINILKDYLYDAMRKIPELFDYNMLSKEYQEKIEQILPKNEIKQRDKIAADLNEGQDIKITDMIYQKKLVNENLKNEILKHIPQDYSDLEKSIYIYIKLCQFLSYDPYFYANNKAADNKKHEEFANISKIGIETNNVICYEFVTIYSELLKDMGLKVASTTKLDMNVDDENTIIYTNFANQHSNLKYSVDEIIVSADSTTSVLKGDIINAKMNNPLNGLQCLSVEQSKKDKFNDALNKVYSKLKIENSIFIKYGKDFKEKPLIEKLRILFNDLSGIEFNPTDFISYITSIKHELFTDDELDWHLKISYIGKKSGDNQYPVALFSINTNDIKNVKIDTIQYLYDTKQKCIIKFDKEEIEKMFINGELFFINGADMQIPNIETSQTNNRNR